MPKTGITVKEKHSRAGRVRIIEIACTPSRPFRLEPPATDMSRGPGSSTTNPYTADIIIEQTGVYDGQPELEALHYDGSNGK